MKKLKELTDKDLEKLAEQATDLVLRERSAEPSQPVRREEPRVPQKKRTLAEMIKSRK